MSDTGEITRLILRMLESLSPDTDDPTENELRFRALLDVDNKIKRLISHWVHAADEIGE